MFDSLLGSKFSNKCKHATKCIAARTSVIRKKKQAMLRFLRKDIADLIARGLDENAFGRMDALIAETNHASCYDMIDHYCEYVTSQLPTMQKRECPPDVMEAIATLIYAAARFSDLPELCDLRRLFTERYGSQMESSVNAEFVLKLQKKSFLTGKKLRMIQDIAQEFSVTWDCKSFERKMSNPSASVLDKPTRETPIFNQKPLPTANARKETPICNQINKPQQPRKETAICNQKPLPTANARKERVTNMLNEDIPCSRKLEATHRIISQKNVQPEQRDIHVVSSISNGQRQDLSEKARKVIANEPENVEPLHPTAAAPPYFKMKDNLKGRHKDDQLKECITRNKLPWVNQEQGLIGLAREVVEGDSAASIVPPYTKPKGSKSETHAEAHHDYHYTYDKPPRAPEQPMDPRDQEKLPVRSVNSTNDRAFNMIPPPYVKPRVKNLPDSDRSNGGESKDHPNELLNDEKPKPISVRRRQKNPHTTSEIESTIDDTKLVSQTPGGRRGSGGQQTSTTYDDDCNERGKRRDRDPKRQVEEYVEDAVYYDRHVNVTSSSRRRHGGEQTSAIYDDDCNQGGKRRDWDPKRQVQEYVKGAVDYERHVNGTSNGRRRHGSRQNIDGTYDGDCNEDEEVIMDQLLMHYSKKEMDAKHSKTRTRTRTPPAEIVVGAGKVHEHHSDVKLHPEATKAVNPQFQRAASFSLKLNGQTDVVKGHARAASMQPEMLSPGGDCVHPRLPDYDDLTARFMALKRG